MVLSVLSEIELPEHYGLFTTIRVMNTGGAADTDIVLAAGHHPKCRLVSAQIISFVHDTAANKYTIEKGDGTDLAAQATASATVFNSVDFVPVIGIEIARNESVQFVADATGGALTVGMLVAHFETIH